MEETKQKLKAYPRFNNHGKECSNHQNWMLDNDFTKQSDRELLIQCIDKHIGDKEEK